MKKIIYPLLAAVALLAVSCGSIDKLTYFQDMEVLQPYEVQPQPEAHITKGDRLGIIVTCSEPALAAPFNLASGTFSVDPMTGEVDTEAVALSEKGYLVDKDGCINFPVLGTIQVEGFTVKELEQYIADCIINLKYIREPIVIVEFLNFQFTVLGEAAPAIYSAYEGINILEALAMAGDMAETAKRSELWVIRTENGIRTVYSLNMKSKDVFDSPVYYLKQNDLIYVKPAKTKMDSTREYMRGAMQTVLNLIATGASVVSVLYWSGVINK